MPFSMKAAVGGVVRAPPKPSPSSSGLRDGLEGGAGTWEVPEAASEEDLRRELGAEFRAPWRLCEWPVPMATVGWSPQQSGTSGPGSKLTVSSVPVSKPGATCGCNAEQTAFQAGLLPSPAGPGELCFCLTGRNIC